MHPGPAGSRAVRAGEATSPFVRLPYGSPSPTTPRPHALGNDRLSLLPWTSTRRPAWRIGVSDAMGRLTSALAGRYRVERELGAGGMAIVYLAHDLRHNRKVALKVLREDLTASVGGARFQREIAIAAQLQHPHILPLHESGEVARRFAHRADRGTPPPQLPPIGADRGDRAGFGRATNAVHGGRHTSGPDRWPCRFRAGWNGRVLPVA